MTKIEALAELNRRASGVAIEWQDQWFVGESFECKAWLLANGYENGKCYTCITFDDLHAVLDANARTAERLGHDGLH